MPATASPEGSGFAAGIDLLPTPRRGADPQRANRQRAVGAQATTAQTTAGPATVASAGHLGPDAPPVSPDASSTAAAQAHPVDPGPAIRAVHTARWTRGRVVDALTAVVLVGLFGWMVAEPQLQAVPYHLMFLTLIGVYGFRVWPLPVTVVVITLVVLSTGAVIVDAYLRGRLEVDETFEVMLMPAILVAMVWHARRRDTANRALGEAWRRAEDRRAAETRFLRDTAHALRNPVAVGRGYLDLATDRLGADSEACELAHHVRGELARIDRMAASLLDVAEHPDADLVAATTVDATALAAELFDRWSATEPRRWLLDIPAEAAPVRVNEDRLGDALDAVVDNALRFTGEVDTIRIVCAVDDGRVLLAVADSGPGIPADDLTRVFERFCRSPRPDGSLGTGLGLAFLATVAASHGGTTVADLSREGGALVGVLLPLAGGHTAPHS